MLEDSTVVVSYDFIAAFYNSIALSPASNSITAYPPSKRLRSEETNSRLLFGLAKVPLANTLLHNIGTKRTVRTDKDGCESVEEIFRRGYAALRCSNFCRYGTPHKGRL